MKKVLCIMLALVMILGVFAAIPVSVGAEEEDVAEIGTSKSSSDAVAWARAQKGRNDMDYDGAYGVQCVDFIYYYYDFLGEGARGGHADYYIPSSPYFSGKLPSGWSISNSPSPGAVVVWAPGVSMGRDGWYADAGHGHIGVVTNTYNGKFDFVNQNLSGKYVEECIGYPTSAVATFLQPNFADSAPHTHNYNTYVYNWTSHPHYSCYKCSCGEVKEDRNKPNYSASCPDCNHTVSYNANGGTGAPSSQVKKYLSTLYLSSSKPTRENYEFLGWSTDQNAASAQYQPGAIYNTDANLSLYAVWKLKSYAIKYDTNGGKNGPDNDQVPIGSDYTIPETIPSKQYQLFLGWTPFPEYSSVQYEAGDTIPSGEAAAITDAYETITLYAVWKEPTKLSLNQKCENNTKKSIKNRYEYYYTYTPSKTGFYTIDVSSSNKDDVSILNLYSNEYNNSNSFWGEGRFAYSLEANHTYIFGLLNYNNTARGSITLSELGFSSWKSEATKPAMWSEYTFCKEFNPQITCYDNNSNVVFSGDITAFKNMYKLGVSGGESYEVGGNYTLPVTIGEGNITYSMPVSVIGSKLISIDATTLKDISIVQDDNRWYSQLMQSLENVELSFTYENNTIVTLNLGSTKRYYKGKWINITPQTPVLGNNTVVIEYDGLTTSFEYTLIESPVEKMVVISSPSIFSNEYFYTGYNGYISAQISDLLADHPIKIRVYYKDKSSKIVTINKNTYLDPEDELYGLIIESHISSWGDPEAENYITISYQGVSVDAYINVNEAEGGYDALEDFEVKLPDSFDPNHYCYYPNLIGATIKLVFASGQARNIVIDQNNLTFANSGDFYVDTNYYNFYIYNYNNDDPDTWYLRIANITRPIVAKCPNTVTDIEVIDTPNLSPYLLNNLLKVQFSDGTIQYTKVAGYTRSSPSNLITDNGLILVTTPHIEKDLSLTLEEYWTKLPIRHQDSNECSAFNLSYLIGKYTDLSDGYQIFDRSQDDIEALIKSLQLFTGDRIISSAQAYQYAKNYYGLSLNDIHTSSYYSEIGDVLVFPFSNDNGFYSPVWSEVVSEYLETSNSYIFKYSDNTKTEYIEISKDLKLLSISNTAPIKESEHSIIMAGGYSSRDAAVAGKLITICVNIPEGMEFVKWTSDNSNLIFTDETSVKTTFNMVSNDVKITPLFKNSSSESIFLGDSDGDGEITITDATLIQRNLADMDVPVTEEQLMHGDVDGSGELEISDVTYIQRFLAGMPVPFAIGELK